MFEVVFIVCALMSKDSAPCTEVRIPIQFADEKLCKDVADNYSDRLSSPMYGLEKPEIAQGDAECVTAGTKLREPWDGRRTQGDVPKR